MRLTDRMIENTKELNKQLKKQNDIQQDADEDETGQQPKANGPKFAKARFV